jgi:hypothetical protein
MVILIPFLNDSLITLTGNFLVLLGRHIQTTSLFQPINQLGGVAGLKDCTFVYNKLILSLMSVMLVNNNWSCDDRRTEYSLKGLLLLFYLVPVIDRNCGATIDQIYDV